MVFNKKVFLLYKNIFLSMATCIACCHFTYAQKVLDNDSTYYKTFAGYITSRVYFSQKFTSLTLDKNPKSSQLRYLPNTNLNAGIGATYKSLSINLAYGFGFLNPDDEKGKTKYLDLQSHIYGRKLTVDLFGQFYTGYYLLPKGLAQTNANKYYIRPDIKINLAGAAAYKVVNFKKFSYRAAFIQSEQQKKSAGSFLIGAELYYGTVKADSSLVPTIIATQYVQEGVRKLNYIKIGPGVGYAYTLVLPKHFFITGSLTGSVSVDFSKQKGGRGAANRLSLSPGYIYRFVTGYDNGNWNVNASLVGNQLSVKSSNYNNKYIIHTGNFRFTVAKRFMPNSKLKKILKPLNKLLN